MAATPCWNIISIIVLSPTAVGSKSTWNIHTTSVPPSLSKSTSGLGVAGGSEISSKDLERYSRQVMLEEIGYQGQLKLKDAKVCVVEVRGIGNPITTRFVAMGVGKL